MTLLLVTFFISFFITFLLTPLAIRWGRLAIDYPGELTIHSAPTPRTGGLAIYGGFLGAIIAMIFVNVRDFDEYAGLFIAGTLIITLTGLREDIRALPPLKRLFLEIIASSAVIFSGIYIHTSFLQIFGIFLTVIYLSGAANAMNMLDGMDGLAAGVAGIASVFLAIIAFVQGYIWVAVCSIAILGACLGFLPYNFHHAKIFMGDTGSLFLGFTLAVLTVSVMPVPIDVLGFLGPILLLGVPLFDTTLAISRRLLHRKPLFTGDRSHFYDQLMDRGLSQNQTVLVCYGLGILFGVTALILQFIPSWVGGLLIALEILELVAIVWKLNLFSI